MSQNVNSWSLPRKKEFPENLIFENDIAGLFALLSNFFMHSIF